MTKEIYKAIARTQRVDAAIVARVIEEYHIQIRKICEKTSIAEGLEVLSKHSAIAAAVREHQETAVMTEE